MSTTILSLENSLVEIKTTVLQYTNCTSVKELRHYCQEHDINVMTLKSKLDWLALYEKLLPCSQDTTADTELTTSEVVNPVTIPPRRIVVERIGKSSTSRRVLQAVRDLYSRSNKQL